MSRDTTHWVVLALALAGAWLIVAIVTPLVIVLARTVAAGAGWLLFHALRPSSSGRHVRRPGHHPASGIPDADQGLGQDYYVLADRLPAGETKTKPLGLPVDEPDRMLVTEPVDTVLVARVLDALLQDTPQEGHHG
jgi:hypothetical protein